MSEARFEFDPEKSAANLIKHGIDFLQAQRVWDDPARWQGTLTYPDEARSMVIGAIGGKMWSVVITERDNVTRIISARRSRIDEVQKYARRS